MDIKVEITPQQVSDHLTHAILDSVIGAQLRAAVEESVKKALTGGWNTPSVVDGVARSIVRDVVMEIANTPETRARIRAAVETYLAEKFTDQGLSAMLDKAWRILVDG